MTLATATFADITLNEKQIECVNSLTGPVMVLAGPGTGKTTVVIKRIENMIKSGIDPESILALTFSEAAASEMKIRILNQAGTNASSTVIHTYHAFCSDIISQNPLRFELIENFNVIDDLNKHRYMRDVIDSYRPKHLVTKVGDPYFYISYLLQAVHSIKLNRIKKENYFEVIECDPGWKLQLKQLLADKISQIELEKAGKRNRLKTVIKEIESLEDKIKKAAEVWDIYELYNRKLVHNGFIDFDDMINLVLDAFEDDPLFLEEIRSNFSYILVDEYQDTNHSQNELIFKLASDRPDANIFIVGDDDQIIYSFQGAQVDNLERFLRQYPEARVICLNENNRSTQSILDFSYHLINQDQSRLESNEDFSGFNITKKLVAKNSKIIAKDQKVQLHSFIDTIQENNFIVEQIQTIIKENPELPLSEIAVLTRTNAELDYFAEKLKAIGISFQISRQKDLFSLKPSLLVYLYLKALENHISGSMGLFGLIAHPPFSIDAADYTFLTKEHSRSYNDFITLIKENLNKHTWKNKDNILSFIETFDYLKTIVNEEKLSNLIVYIINKTGILNYYAMKEMNRFEHISSLKKFVDEVKTFEKITHPATLTMLLSYLENSIKENISLHIDENDFIENAIQLITVHKSKGREFSYLLLPNLLAKNWEKRRSTEVLKLPINRADFSKESESARLLFVACSRARHSLILTYSTVANGKNTEISSFIKNISDDKVFLETIHHDLTSDEYVDELINTFSLSTLRNNKGFMEDLKLRASRHVMSPSSLHTYETCPKQFLYNYIYRIPLLEAINKYFSFGTAIHKALEKFIKLAMQKKSYADKNTLIKYFTAAIDKELFESMNDRETSKTYGVKVLDTYYQSILVEPIEHYKAVEMNLDLIPVENYLIKGKIDLVKTLNNNDHCLVDYKTGNRNTSKGQVLNDGGSHSHYLDQIRFYKLLYETKYTTLKAGQGILLFIEVPDKSIYISLTDEDNSLIKAKILSAFEKINRLEFTGVDEATQQAEACNKCNYKFLCRLNTL